MNKMVSTTRQRPGPCGAPEYTHCYLRPPEGVHPRFPSVHYSWPAPYSPSLATFGLKGNPSATLEFMRQSICPLTLPPSPQPIRQLAEAHSEARLIPWQEAVLSRLWQDCNAQSHRSLHSCEAYPQLRQAAPASSNPFCSLVPTVTSSSPAALCN